MASTGITWSNGSGSPLRDERTAAILGVTLGVTFTVCFATGLVSHLSLIHI